MRPGLRQSAAARCQASLPPTPQCSACASRCKPSIRKDCVVVPGVATGAVVIGNCAVELVVMHVLQPELYIEPRPEIRAAIIERDVVELEGPTRWSWGC